MPARALEMRASALFCYSAISTGTSPTQRENNGKHNRDSWLRIDIIASFGT